MGVTLKTIKMVEETIRKHNGEYTRTELWKVLPRKMMYQTFKEVLGYLLNSNKIVIQNEKVVWVFYPKTAKKLVAQTTRA